LTCIVGIVEDGKVWMGADTQHTRGSTKLKDRSPKIFQKGPFTIAAAGSARGSQLLFYGVNIEEIELTDDEKSNVVKLADAVQSANRKAKHYSKESEIEKGEIYFIVSQNNRLFCVEFNYYVHEVESFIAIGGAADFAEGVLHYINKYHSSLSPKSKIKRALTLSECYDSSVSSPFTIIET
jgi:ATP-dependent protease HslVU (ClpYQ) peptidase subunit